MLYYLCTSSGVHLLYTSLGLSILREYLPEYTPLGETIWILRLELVFGGLGILLFILGAEILPTNKYLFLEINLGCWTEFKLVLEVRLYPVPNLTFQNNSQKN